MLLNICIDDSMCILLIAIYSVRYFQHVVPIYTEQAQAR